ncbi:hypothetical protein HPP92_008225 [Vanilla planifolia]|uniref:Uncharacterized protein n=1 Tax=Vanilla planifolia TaxID=51239 RepID=A0A835V715_VANPL|nr:hypothetical protein HPP92_008225 [Vanilla planifolia]
MYSHVGFNLSTLCAHLEALLLSMKKFIDTKISFKLLVLSIHCLTFVFFQWFIIAIASFAGWDLQELSTRRYISDCVLNSHTASAGFVRGLHSFLCAGHKISSHLHLCFLQPPCLCSCCWLCPFMTGIKEILCIVWEEHPFPPKAYSLMPSLLTTWMDDAKQFLMSMETALVASRCQLPSGYRETSSLLLSLYGILVFLKLVLCFY